MKQTLIALLIIFLLVLGVRFIDRNRIKPMDESLKIISEQLQKEASESGAELTLPDLTALQQPTLLLPTLTNFQISGNGISKDFFWVVFDYKRDDNPNTWDIVDLKRVYPAFSRMKEGERYIFPVDEATRNFHEKFLALPLGYVEIMPILCDAATQNENGSLVMNFFVERCADSQGVPLFERVGDN